MQRGSPSRWCVPAGAAASTTAQAIDGAFVESRRILTDLAKFGKIIFALLFALLVIVLRQLLHRLLRGHCCTAYRHPFFCSQSPFRRTPNRHPRPTGFHTFYVVRTLITMHGVLYSTLTSSALARSLTVPRTLMRGIPCACAKISLSEHVLSSLSLAVVEENRLLLRHALPELFQHGVETLEGLREERPVPTAERKPSG